MEEVASELVGDGVPAAQVRSTEMRTRLAQRLLGLSRFWWTDTQIKQLLLRNCATRPRRRGLRALMGGAEVNQGNEDGTTHPDVRFGSVAEIND